MKKQKYLNQCGPDCTFYKKGECPSFECWEAGVKDGGYKDPRRNEEAAEWRN